MSAPDTATFQLPQWLHPQLLQGMLRGIEKESLRMQPDGHLSQQPHPQALGSALTHPQITTDYSEALMELITPPCDSPTAALEQMTLLHAVVARSLPEGERLWPMSMPCMLSMEDEEIPLAQYGSSNLGKFKTLYRRGLGVRYGRRMQTIAGIHYNVSFPEGFFLQWQSSVADAQGSLQAFTSARYLGLIRNFQRLLPLVIYLLGASPVVCGCFLKGRAHDLQPLMPGNWYLPEATALRMGKLGYQNSAQRELGIHYNDLNEYVSGLRAATATPFEAFAQLGLEDEQNEPLQINDHVLQIENEYYSLIRPKQIAQSGETPAQALANRGIQYVELRAVDLDPFSPIGISLETACFLETLALYAMLLPSPEMSASEEDECHLNQNRMVERGRQSGITLHIQGDEVSFQDWAGQHLNAMQPLAALLDQQAQVASGATSNCYQHALSAMQQRLSHSDITLSAQLLDRIRDAGGMATLGKQLAETYQQSFQQQELPPERVAQFEALAKHSLSQQAALEQDSLPFEAFLAPYRQ